MSATKVAYTIPEAAEQVSVSAATIRRAIHATGKEATGPKPLRAKNIGSPLKPAYRIAHDELVRWFDASDDV